MRDTHERNESIWKNSHISETQYLCILGPTELRDNFPGFASWGDLILS